MTGRIIKYLEDHWLNILGEYIYLSSDILRIFDDVVFPVEWEWFARIVA
ncbi:MAG: hypothetical protein ACE5H0_11570 [Bacteroidota bacterium]